MYLMMREAKELLTTISMKYNFEPTKIFQKINVNQKGLNIKDDNDVVRELPEGQDMILEFSRIKAPSVRREQDQGVDGVLAVRSLLGYSVLSNSGDYLLKLIF